MAAETVKTTKKKQGRFLKQVKIFMKNIQLTLLAIPGIVWFILFSYMPMFAIILAFKKFSPSKGIWGSDWVGFDNFQYLFASNDAGIIIRNTILYNIVFILLNTILGIILALMLESVTKKLFVKVYQTIMLLPHFVSWVITGFVMTGLLSFETGILNAILQKFGLEKIMWYSTTAVWPIIIVLANVWKQAGYQALFYYGSILGIDQSLYEASEIDGASKMQQIIHITMPLLRPTICTLLIMSIGRMMRGDFGLFYYIPNDTGMLYPVTDILDTYIYRTMRVVGDIGVSAAVSLFQSVVGFVLVIAANSIVKKIDDNSAMF